MKVNYWRFLFFCALVVATWGFLKDVSGLPSAWMPNDKVMHLLIFLVLTSLFQASFSTHWRWPLLTMAAYGALIEILQGMTPVRSADIFDWLADMVGAILALMLYPKIQSRLSLRTASVSNNGNNH